MVLRDIRRGDQHRGSALRLDLREGDRARSGDNQIAGGETVVHVIYVLTHVEIIAFVQLHALFFEQIGHELALLTVAVDVVVSAVLRGAREQVGHRLIDAFRAQRPAEGQDDRAVVGETQTLLRLVMLGREDRGTDRVAGQHELRLVGEAGLRVLVREHHAGDGLRQHLIGHAGIGVLLMDDGLVAEVARREDDRAADVAARTDADIGVEFPDDALRVSAGCKGIMHRLDIVDDLCWREAAVKARDHHGLDRISRLLDEPLLHAVAVADEEDLSVGVLLPDRPRDRKRRIDMPGGTAAGE